MDAVDGSASLEAAVPAWLIVPLTLVRGVVVITEYGWGRARGTGIGLDLGVQAGPR